MTASAETPTKVAAKIAEIRRQVAINVDIAKSTYPEGPIVDGKRIQGMLHSQEILAGHVEDRLRELEAMLAASPAQEQVATATPMQGERIAWESPEEWELEQRVFNGANAVRLPKWARTLIGDLWRQYCFAANPDAAPTATPMQVKPLEWDAGEDDDGSYMAKAHALGLDYAVDDDGIALPPYASRLNQFVIGRFDTLEAAKAAAQADYERRINSALVTADDRTSTFADGIKAAVTFVQKRLDDYVDEHGSTDPDTGTVEFPGNGDETVCEWLEIIEGITALVGGRP